MYPPGSGIPNYGSLTKQPPPLFAGARCYNRDVRFGSLADINDPFKLVTAFPQTADVLQRRERVCFVP